MIRKIWKEAQFWYNLVKAVKIMDEEERKTLLNFQPNDVF